MEGAKDVFEEWESDPDVAKYMTWTSHHDINKTYEKDIPCECNNGTVVREGKLHRLYL